MRYVFEINGKTGEATLQIGDQPPVLVLDFDVKFKRDPVVNEEKSLEFISYDAGPTVEFSLTATLDYSSGDAPANSAGSCE